MRVPHGRHHVVVVCLLAALPLPSPASAQQLDVGARLRVTTPAGRSVGRLDVPLGDSVVLGTPAGRVPVALSEIQSLERSLGKRGHAMRGALIGGGVMAVLGVLAITSEDDGAGEDWGGVVAAAALPAYVAIGAGTGALVGLAWRTERWVPVQLGIGFSSSRR